MDFTGSDERAEMLSAKEGNAIECHHHLLLPAAGCDDDDYYECKERMDSREREQLARGEVILPSFPKDDGVQKEINELERVSST